MKIMAGTLAVFILGCGSLYGQLRGSAELYQDTLKRVVLIVYQTDDSIVYRMPNEALFQVARAWELDSFLFKNGDAYYPLVVDDGKGARPKLLQQLAGGSKFSLFHLQEAGRFFIRDQGGRLWPISRDKAEARATLSQLAEGCAAVDHMTRLAEPKSLHLSVFVRNLDRCRYRLFPQPRVGVVGGAVLWRGKSLLPASDDGDASGGSARIDYGHTYLAGLFGEIPLTKLSPNLYLRSEIYYSDQSFRVYQPGGPENYNLQVELRRLEIPVQIQYVFTVARFHPFLGAGGQYLYNLQVNKTEAQARPANGGWEWVFKEESDPTRHEIGFVLAGGVHIPLDYRRLLTIQTRYYTAGISSPKEGPSGDYFTLQAGINF